MEQNKKNGMNLRKTYNLKRYLFIVLMFCFCVFKTTDLFSQEIDIDDAWRKAEEATQKIEQEYLKRKGNKQRPSISTIYRKPLVRLSVNSFTTATKTNTYNPITFYEQTIKNQNDFKNSEDVKNHKINTQFKQEKNQFKQEMNQFEQEVYKKFNDVFDNIDFSASHWESNGNIDDRKKDLIVLAGNISKKIGIKGVTMEYLYYEEEGVRGKIVVSEKYFPSSKDIAGKYKESTREILINKDDIKHGKKEDLIETIAEECYHVWQKEVITTYQKLKKEREEYSKTFTDKVNNEEKIKQIQEKINTLSVSEKKINQWETDLKNYPKEKDYNELIKSIDKATTNDERKYYEELKKQWEDKYENLELEEDAKRFAEAMKKVYKNK